MADPVVQPPSSEDIAIPTPPPREQGDEDQLFRFLSQTAKAGQFNATLQRQERATLLALFGKAVAEAALASATADATVIANPPTQANVVALQASLNAAITALNAAVTQVNSLSATLGAMVDAANANLKSLPATS
jgi:hypothetical protein